MLNGRSYMAVGVDASYLKVTLENGTKEVTLTHQQCTQDLRLACARTYAAVQGLSLRDQRILLLQTRRPFVDWRKLYVASSRVTSGSLLHIPTPEQERVHWSLEGNVAVHQKRPGPELEIFCNKKWRPC